MPWIRRNQPQEFRLLPIRPQAVCFFGWSRPVLQLNPRPFFFDFLLFLIIFLHTFQEAILAVRVLNMLNMHINSLGRNLALNLFAYNDANSMLGNTADSSTFAMATFVGHSFLNSTDCLDSHNITLLVDVVVSTCGACGLEPTLSGTRQGLGERPCSTSARSKGFQVAGPGGPLPSAPRSSPEWIAECKGKGAPTIQRPSSQLLPWTGPGYQSPTMSGKGQRSPEPSPQQPHRSGLDHRRQSGPRAGGRGTDWVVWRSLWLPWEGSEVRLPGLSSWVPSPLPSVGFNLCLSRLCRGHHRSTCLTGYTRRCVSLV